jgi:hypothetical protein
MCREGMKNIEGKRKLTMMKRGREREVNERQNERDEKLEREQISFWRRDDQRSNRIRLKKFDEWFRFIDMI